MARKKKKKKTTLRGIIRQHWDAICHDRKRQWGRYCIQLFVVLTFAVLGIYGMTQVEESVLMSPPQEAAARIELIDVPRGLDGVMTAALEPFAQEPWSSETICSDIGSVLERIGWVKAVVSVHRFPDRRIEVACTYRKALAMVQKEEGFYLVDDECVRLPGIYNNHPDMKLIQGVRRTVPRAGEPWQAPELRAGIDLIKILSAEPFFDQVTAVLVHNYGGRSDPRAAHLVLATDQAGERILWGSEPGGEVEENTVAQKLELLRSNYRRFGRIDAKRGIIDISVHPDRIITPEIARSRM